MQTGLSRKLLTFAVLAFVSHAGAAPLFDDDSILQINLAGPLGSMIEANDDTQEQPFVLRANNVEHGIKVRVRGKSRRRVCDFPPLRFNFVKSETADTVFAGQNKLKIVMPCTGDERSQVDALEEYAAYKIFSLLSDFGYQVRLLHLTYTDTDGMLKEPTSTRYGFLLESASSLAERVGAQQADAAGVVLSKLNARQAATVYIYQYLIGNTDWSMVLANEDDKCCHNGDLFDIGTERYYVPYDFDLSGLVNARYAKPDPSLRISRVTKRRYRGYCVSGDALKEALVAIKAQQADILGVVGQLPDLSQKELKAKVKYLESFFKLAEDEDRLLKSFENACL